MTQGVNLLPGISALRLAVIHSAKLDKQDQQKKESKHEPKSK